MIRIRTGSRLHFGLFALPSDHAGCWLNHEGQPTLPRRHFGGVGLMINEPEIVVGAEIAPSWSAQGRLADRALRFAQTYCQASGVKDAFKLFATSDTPEHVGLGTGTQLGLAVGRAIAELTQQPERDATTLARYVGRGMRSALGIHGFERGGLLVEGGKLVHDAVAPLLARFDFPADWRVMLIRPRALEGTHGTREIEAFAGLTRQPPDERATDALCRIVLLGLLPALQEHDLQTFGEALYDFNRRVGEMFRAVQNGPYAHPRIEELVHTIRGLGIKGVAQSSWGPTVFAVVNAGEEFSLSETLPRRCGLAEGEIRVATACNHGAVLSTEY